MKKIKLTFAFLAVILTVISCKDEKQEKAQKALNAYTKYVDSVDNIEEEKAIANWDVIENDQAKLKMEAENAVEISSDKTKLQTDLTESEKKYEELKTTILTEKANTSTDDPKTMRYKALFGPNYINDDMKFNWVNKDNILSVYDNFVTTVHKNKDSYSREDWDEIKMVYEALDSRKNTVEKEGLTSHDNNKIALLKLKFAPMYTLNRMGAKADENAEAKK
jgi:hypothetical protein